MPYNTYGTHVSLKFKLVKYDTKKDKLFDSFNHTTLSKTDEYSLPLLHFLQQYISCIQ